MQFKDMTIEASDQVAERLAECEKFIESNDTFRESWERSWEVLKRLECTHMYLDFAPMSFTWQARGLVGGLIFHRPGGWSGGAPEFAVNIGGAYGWSLHT